MPITGFRLFKTPGEKKQEDPIQRRRAQVRKAQRTYQERKNAYVRSLEEALSNAKASQAQLVQDNLALQDFLLLIQNHIPGDLCDQYLALPLSRTQGNTPNTDPLSGYSLSPSNHSWETSSNSNSHLPAPQTFPVFTLHVTSSPGCRPYILGDFDSVSVGMEFVLSLENPCLAHIHGDGRSPESSHGHALTATSQLLVISGNETTNPPPNPLQLSRNMSRAILANLLHLAPQVNVLSNEDLDDREVTPIQAWDWIFRQTYFKQVQVSKLKRVADEIGRLAKCFGFGASIPAREFERILYECIGAQVHLAG